MRHPLVVVVAEEVGEEEVTVFVVVGSRELEVGELYSTTGVDRLRSRFLVRQHGLQFETTKLHIRSDTEEALSATDERRLRGHGHITGFHEFDNLIFFAFVAEFEVLSVKVERCF